MNMLRASGSVRGVDGCGAIGVAPGMGVATLAV